MNKNNQKKNETLTIRVEVATAAPYSTSGTISEAPENSLHFRFEDSGSNRSHRIVAHSGPETKELYLRVNRSLQGIRKTT